MDNSEKTLDQLVALCKGRGFVYPGSEPGERNLFRKTHIM